MVLWQGLTEGGTAVPVQVTEEGKVVAQGLQGEKGDKGDTGDTGPQGPPGEYGPGDDVELRNAKFTGDVGINVDDPKSSLHVAGNITQSFTSYLGFNVYNAGGWKTVVESPGAVFKQQSDLRGLQLYIGENADGLRPRFTVTTAGQVGIRTGTPGESLTVEGNARFSSDVVIGSRNKEWLIVESGGLAHLVDTEAYSDSFMAIDDDGNSVEASKLKSAISYPQLRDIPAELTMVEQQLQKVMERLKMAPEAGWEVWDGSD